ncbi:uncharacterized protein FFUJ_05409 [Fusarium fujikuroi IMI 58289]|uniref:Ubiquitin-like domain-containing protein n=1 Tax=Gibberella fujikuroi (strain CBS 195.34 / IMI 58289 / NRRL A-6831) TaxID=1279085 RepID=S0E704_GIBF5|nr:uncharacterized protein FFUJ_05409 [Fusarium fujikuroi IMI 58289]CCT69517.1 uncharacterized protein FFUJ_05409 [Fusarium fujikuroi IMI 58289]SCO26542.1 uncharacterized protein FFM5_14811 [Fusarium fujikuroi]
MAHNDIEPVAKLGLSLASSLQVHSEANRRARQRLPKLINLINSTALTLIKVDDVIQENALTKLCLEDVTRLTATCEKVYIGILIMLVRQTESFVGDKEINEIPREETGKYLQSIAHINVWRYESWESLEVQLGYFRYRLTQIKLELMLRYLLGSVAQHQMRAQTRVPGSFETENAIRQLAGQVAYKRASHYKFWSKKVDKWTIIAPPLASSNVSTTDVNSTCSVSSTPTIAVDTKIEETKPVETIPPAETQSPELSKDTEVLADTTAETTSTPTQKDQQPAKEPGPSLLTATRDWIKRIVMPGSHDEWKNQDLEVWQIDLAAHFNCAPTKTFKRLELDDKHVRSALSKATSKSRWRKCPGLLEQYDSLDQRVRQRIDDGIDAAKQSSCRERTWIAMSTASPPLKNRYEAVVQTDASICLFFRLGDEVEPIHVVELHTGKRLTFPYASCKDLDSLRKRLSCLTLGYPASAILKDGKYNFCAEDGTVILPESWESLRRPGMTLNIQNYGTPIPPVFGGPTPFNRRPGMMPPGPSNVVTVGPPCTSTTTSSSSSTRSYTSLTMKQVHGEIEEMLHLSDSWSPDPNTMGTGLGRLLGLWTNALDPHVNATEDSDSEWSCSASDSDYCSNGSVSS